MGSGMGSGIVAGAATIVRFVRFVRRRYVAIVPYSIFPASSRR